MKSNWFDTRKFVRSFCIVYGLILVATVLGGCGSWVSAASSLWPAIEAAVTAAFAFITSVKTLPASVLATVQKIEADVQTALQNASALLTELASNTTATTIQKFQEVLQFILQNFNSILIAINVSDPATVSTATKLVGLAVAAIEAVLAIIPLLMPKLKALEAGEKVSDAELKAADQHATSSIKNIHKVLKSDYHTVVTCADLPNHTTGNPVVDEALWALPQTLP